MRDRNVRETSSFPAWGKAFATLVVNKHDHRVFPGVNRTQTNRTGKLRLSRFPLSSFPLTALLAVMAAAPSWAQEDNPAPAPAAPVATPAQDTPVAPIDVPKGRIRVFVRDAVTKAFLNDAAVFLDDPTLTDLRTIPYYVGDATRRSATNEVLGGPGFTITDELAPHQWTVVVLKEGYETGRAFVTVLADRTIDVTVYLRVRQSIEPFILLSGRDTSNSTRRTLPFVRNIPVGVGNKQEINEVLASAPGFVRNSLNQVHPRGQRFGVATYIDGFLMPSLPTGLLQGTLPQDVIQQYDIHHGGLSAEWGGDVGVAVDLTTRRVGAIPIVEGMLTTGGYGTDELYATVAQRFNIRGRRANQNYTNIERALQPPGTGIGGATIQNKNDIPTGPTFGYLLHVSQRNTNAVTEAPQERATVHNRGYNNLLFAKAEYIPNPLYQITGLLSVNGGRSNIANRTRAGGVGFLGGIEAIGTAEEQQATASATPSQDELFQDQYQKENNTFSLFQVKRILRPRDIPTNPDSTITISIGGLESMLRYENSNSNPDPRDLTNPASPLYQRNSSIEFNPTIKRYYDQFQSQVDFVLSRADHVIKGGILYNNFLNDERYRFEPGSLVALNALYARSPLFVPGSVAPVGGTDGYFNPIVQYQSTNAGGGVTVEPAARAPLSRIRREGEYTSVYLQDTWSFNRPFTLNAGVRLDNYLLSGVSGTVDGVTVGNAKTDTTAVSPRLNMSYEVDGGGFLGFLGGRGLYKGIFRASYNRLFQRPPLGQGTFFSTAAIRPQTGDQYEISYEKQFGRNHTLKGAAYSTIFQNFMDVEGLFPGSQMSTGALVLVNYPSAISEGFEMTYNYNPQLRNDNPLTVFVSYANGSVRLRDRNVSFDSLGRRVTAERASFDQLHTLSMGATYRLPNGASIGTSAYLGSGLYGSRRPGSDDRDSIAEVNMKLSTSPRLFNRTFGFDVSVENLFDQQNRYNYFSSYEGIRVQTGRRILTSVYTRF